MAEAVLAQQPELRLLMGPMTSVHAGIGGAGYIHAGTRWRWVIALNGHPGCCAEDCWHVTPDAALRCFLGAPWSATSERRGRHGVVA